MRCNGNVNKHSIMAVKFRMKRDTQKQLEWSVPGCKGQIVVLVSVVDGGLEVNGNWVVTSNFGGNVNGNDREN
jgi:hypothetical protein